MVLFGICNLSCQIQIFPNFLDINVDLSSGVLVEIVDTQTEKYGIRIPKLSNTTINYNNDFYLCPKDKLIIVSTECVPFLIAISDLNQRVSLARRQPQVEFIRSLRVGHIAAVYGILFNERKYFECRVKYIGAVPELGQGSFIGVEFLHGDEHSQQKIPLDIIEKYVNCVGYKGLITTANWLISIQNYRKMSVRQNSCGDPKSVKPTLPNRDRAMDSFMEKFSQFLISNPTSNSNSLFSENFLQKANDFYSQKSMNKSLSNSQTSLNSLPYEDDSNRNFNHHNNRNNRSRRNSGNIPSLMDLPIPENSIIERKPETTHPVNPRQRADWQPRERLISEEEKYNNHWNGKKFVIVNSVYKSSCSFCGNVKEFCNLKKEIAAGTEIVPFQNQFRCRRCFRMHDRTEMIVVKRCFHVFGKQCLAAAVNLSDGGPVNCPAKLHKSPCWTILSEDDLMSFLTNEELEQYADKTMLSNFKTSINFNELLVDNSGNSNELALIQDGSLLPITEIHVETTNDETVNDEIVQYHYIPNFDEFTCPLCSKLIPERIGVILQQCLHNFCKECLAVKIQTSKEARVQCPFEESPCAEFLMDSEIKVLVSSEVYDLHLNKSIYQFSVDNGETVSFDEYLESLKPVSELSDAVNEVILSETVETVPDLILNENTTENTEDKYWDCPLCKHINTEMEMNCESCTFTNPNSPVTNEHLLVDEVESDESSDSSIEENPQSLLLDKIWNCTLCGEKNSEIETNCKKCTLRNPDCPIKQWTCEICLTETDESKMNCDACTADKPVSITNEIVEKWICKTCGDENKEIHKCCRFCLVERRKPVVVVDQPSEYEELLTLEEGDLDLVENSDRFECPICFVTYEKGEGVRLRECLHVFCKECLAGTINMSDNPEIKCPYLNDDYACDCLVQDREIRASITAEDYENYLTKSINLAEKVIKDSYHCLTIDCKGWWVNEQEVNLIVCPVCEIENCLNCNVIHTNLTCKQYQDKLFNAPDAQAQRTKEMIEVLLQDGSAIKCPNCGIIIQRTYGCDWLRCSCLTEICWATRGARWGPRGSGDTTGGCRCKVNGQPCTPTCRNCH